MKKIALCAVLGLALTLAGGASAAGLHTYKAE